LKLTISNAYGYNGTIDGYMVGAIDGTKFFGSNKKFCPGCLKNNNHNFHRGVVMATIGKGPKLTVGFEMYKPGIDSTSKKDGTYCRIRDVQTRNRFHIQKRWETLADNDSDNLHGDEPENIIQNDTSQVGYRELHFQQFERALRS